MPAPYTAGQYTGGLINATAFNNELQKIEQAFLQYLERTGTAGNQMEEALDMNSHSIVNVATDSEDPSSLVSLQTVLDLIPEAQDFSILTDQVQANATSVTNLTTTQDFLVGEVQSNTQELEDTTFITNRTATMLVTVQDALVLTQDLLAATRATQTNLQGNVTGLTQSLATVQGIATTNQQDIEALETQVAGIQTGASQAALTQLQGVVTALTQTVSVVQNIATTNESDIDALTIEVDANTAVNTQQDLAITSNTDDIVQLQTDLANVDTSALQGQIDGLSSAIGQLQGNINAVSSVVSDNQNIATTNRDRLDNTDTAQAVQDQRLDALEAAPSGGSSNQAQVDQISLDLDAAEADIEVLALTDLRFSFAGILPDNTEVAKVVIPRPSILRTTGGTVLVISGHANAAPTGASAFFTIEIDGTSAGTISFASGSNTAVGSVVVPTTIPAGGVFRILTNGQNGIEEVSLTVTLQEVL